MKKTLVLVLAGFIVWSCNNPTEKSSSDQEAVTHEEHHHHDNQKAHEGHQHHESPEAVELNNGEKWLVNDEMKPFVVQGEELVNTYLQTNQTDYKELATQLKVQNDQLIKSCTMEGKSHDELHKWLHPHLELTKELANETDPAKANETVEHLQKSYQQYHQYFN